LRALKEVLKWKTIEWIEWIEWNELKKIKRKRGGYYR
jgi:hypothetical protein